MLHSPQHREKTLRSENELSVFHLNGIGALLALKNKGVETGAVGVIEGTNQKIETTQCFATSCRAYVPASSNPKSLKKGANVVFKVDK